MRQTTGIIILEGLTGLVLLVGLGLGLIAWRLMSGPTDLAFVKSEIEAAMTEARDGKPVEIDKVSLRWQEGVNEFQVFAEGLEFYSAENEQVASAQSAIIDVHAVSLMRGKIRLKEMQVTGSELTIRREQDGTIIVAGEEIPPVRPVQFHEATSPVQYVEQSILNVVETIAQSSALDDLRRIRLDDFRINLQDVPLQIDWTLETAELDLIRAGSEVEIEFKGLAAGSGAPDRVAMELSFSPDGREFSSFARLEGARVFELPFLKPYAEMITGEMTADLEVSFGVRPQGIDALALDLTTDGGRVVIAGETELELGRNDFALIFDLDANDLMIDGREINAGPVTGTGTLNIFDFVDLIETGFANPTELMLDASELGLDLRPSFESAFELTNVNLDGEWNFQSSELSFTEFAFNMENARVSSAGRIYLAEEMVHEEDLPFGVELNANVSGALSVSTVLEYWPVNLGAGAREWLIENLHQGSVYEADLKLDIEPQSLRQGYLSNENLQVDFLFRDGQFSFLSDMPPIVEGEGSARLNGNSFSLDLERAMFSGWTLTRGVVNIPYFMPKGEDLYIEADGYGDISQVLRTISDSRLQLENDYGLPISDISGSGRASFTMRRPALSDVSYDDTRFRVAGEVTEGKFVNLINDMTLVTNAADISVSNDVIRISGYGELDEAPVEFEWSDRFREDGPERSRLKASGYVGPDLLNRFGIAVRTYMTGDALAEITASGPSAVDFQIVSVDLDLEETRLDIPELNWTKRRGDASSAQVSFRQDTGTNLTRVAFDAEDLKFRGNLALTEEGRLDQLIVDQFYLEDQLDLAGELRRTGPLALELVVSGPFMNAEPLTAGLFSGEGGALPIFGDVDFRAEIDRLRLRRGLEVDDADLHTVFSGPQLVQLDLSGEITGDDEFLLTVRDDGDGVRNLTAEVSNAGAMFEALMGEQFVQGGQLYMTGQLRSGDDPTNLDITVTNTRMVNAPLLTQILSLASLRGLADVMSGEGILFTSINIPLVIDETGYYSPGAKASGPALGMTAKGSILEGGSELSIDGVLVPSFGVNSALGGIPIIGDLFVSREGEGVFAMTYAVRGSLEEARIAVNPLSGILPGVLRRIFENPASEEVPVADAPDDAPAEPANP